VNAGALAGLSTVDCSLVLGQSRVFYSMAHDGLLWKWAGDVHPKFRTPWKSTAVTGFGAACLARSSDWQFGAYGQHRHATGIRHRLGAVIILRKRRPICRGRSKTPMVPLVPILGIVVSLGLMASLNRVTWYRLVIWLVIAWSFISPTV